MGQIVSVTGSQMQFVAINWHVYLLTKSAFALGLVGLFRGGPIILCSLIGGVVADAVDRKRLKITGAADTVSTVLRQTIRQLVTPNYLRGRMTSINMMFFMGGPQLGELEAGVVAALIGAPLSVVVGGFGCLISACVAALKSRSLMEYEG